MQARRVLHVHVREPDGKGSKRLEMFNEMLDRLRTAVPKMILQVGGSISFAPKDEGESAKWLRGRYAAHACRAESGARPGDDRDQHQPDERDGAHHGRGLCRHVDGRARLQARLHRDVLRVRSGLREGAPQAPRRRRHPAALHDRIDQGPGDGRTDRPPGPVHGSLRARTGSPSGAATMDRTRGT